MRKRTEVVSFRATPELLLQIDNVRQHPEESRGEWVKNIIQAHLHSQDQQLLLDQFLMLDDAVQKLQASLEELRRTHLKSTYLLLVTNGLSPESARERVRALAQEERTEP